jgi:acylphosphatase
MQLEQLHAKVMGRVQGVVFVSLLLKQPNS